MALMAKYHYDNSWIFFTDGFAIGKHIWFRKEQNEVSKHHMRHELCHVAQCWDLSFHGWWWTGAIAFIFLWLCQWFVAGFKCLFFKYQFRKFWRCAYYGVKLEEEANAAEQVLELVPGLTLKDIAETIKRMGIAFNKVEKTLAITMRKIFGSKR